MDFAGLAYDIFQGGSFLLLFLAIFIISKWLLDLFTPFSLDENLTGKDNFALGISVSGYLAGVTIIFIGATIGPSHGLFNDLISVGEYSVLGLLLLNAARKINDKFTFHKFSVRKEILEDKNAGTGIVVLGAYISSALVIAGAVHGEVKLNGSEGGGWESGMYGVFSAISFFLIGQLALILFSKIYEAVTPYSFHNEIENDNVAAGMGFSGGMIAIGLIIMKAISGDLISWKQQLFGLGLDLLLIFVLLIFIRFIFDKLIIPQHDLSDEIKKDKNLAAGILEMTVSICFACVIYFLM
ncbi:MAG: DUF350 domain-containing protein [Flavobacteriales bacterium]